MVYRIQFTPSAEREFLKLPKPLQGRLDLKIDALARNPRPGGVVKLAGQEAYRIRVGDYRVVYEIHDRVLVVLVLTVGHRGDVYRAR